MTPDADCRSVVYAVRNTTQQRDFQSFRDIFDRYLQEQASAADLLTVASAPLMTGFSALDELLGGIQRSDLIILAARPSVGKSTLALRFSGEYTVGPSAALQRSQLSIFEPARIDLA